MFGRGGRRKLRAVGRGDPDPSRRGVSRRGLFRLGLSGGDATVVDYDSVAARVRAGWEAAPSEPLLRALEPVGPVLAGLVGVMADERVLDAGAGDGNVALACLERGAVVEACDIAEA